MKRGAEACTDGQRQHASCITVARAVVSFGHGHRIGIVDHGKPSTVESLEGLCNIEPDPSLAEVGCGRGPAVVDSSWKPDADRPVPAHRLQRCLDGGENLARLGRSTVIVPFQFADKCPRCEVEHPCTKSTTAQINAEDVHRPSLALRSRMASTSGGNVAPCGCGD